MHPYDNPIWFVWRFMPGAKRAVPWIFNSAEVLADAIGAWRADGSWFHIQLVRKADSWTPTETETLLKGKTE